MNFKAGIESAHIGSSTASSVIQNRKQNRITRRHKSYSAAVTNGVENTKGLDDKPNPLTTHVPSGILCINAPGIFTVYFSLYNMALQVGGSFNNHSHCWNLGPGRCLYPSQL